MKCKLEEIVDITMGQSPKSMYYNSDGNGYPFLQGNRTFGSKYPTFDTYTTVMTKRADAGDVIMSVRAPVGDLNITPVDICLGRGVCGMKMKDGNQDFLYYLMKYNVKNLINKESGTVFGSVNRNDISKLEVELPDNVEDRKKIAIFLKQIDDKIETNNKINRNLLEQLECIYNEEVKGSNSPVRTVTLDELCNIFTGRKNANQNDEDGKYLFFTCGDTPLKINSYIYDGPAIIISGNGSYTGRTLFYNGKFDLYQRTYACTLKDEITPEFIFGLYAVLKIELHKKISGGTHGSSIPYIVMNDLAKFEFNINDDSFNEFSKQSKVILDIMMLNNVEKEKLATLRDSLLPKLMSGKLDISNIEI